MHNYSDKFGNSQRSLLSPTGGVKSKPPNTEKWPRKRHDENYNNDMSNETKRGTDYKHEQQMKQQHAQHAHHLSMNEERTSLSHFVHLVSHVTLAQDLSLVISSP